MKTKALLLTFIPCCCLSLFTYAQRDSTATKTDADRFEDVTLSGLLYNNSGEPVAAATVLLCNTDSSMIRSAQTDTLGAYHFQHIKRKDYLLIFRRLSYPPKHVLLPADTLGQLKGYLITIAEGGKTMLSEVNVVGRKNSGLEKIPEGFSFRIDDRFSRLTIWETLKRTPFVTAEDNGTLNVLGKTGAVVYINGRKSNLSGNDLWEMLRNMSSENIEKLEIITAPSSKYEAQGNAGIINIMLKKQMNEGLSGSVSLISEFSYYNAYRANTNLNYARGKVTSQLSLRGARDNNRTTEDTNISLQTLNLRNASFLNRHEWSYPIGATWINDIAFSDKHRLNVQANGSLSTGHLDWHTTNRYSKLHAEQADSTLVSDNKQKEASNSFSIDINDQIKLDTLGSNISAGISFFSRGGENNSPYEITQGLKHYFFKTTSSQAFKNYAAQADWHKAFKSALSLDAGVRVNRNESDNRNSFIRRIDNVEVSKRSQENDYEYREWIYALYASLNWRIGAKWNTVLGARFEQTNINGYEAVRAEPLKRRYDNLFPNVSVSYELNSNHQLGLNINSRINRPAFWELNPTPVYSSPTLYVKGNAFLLPGRSLNFEFSYVLHRKLTFLLSYNRLSDHWMQFAVTKRRSDTIVFDRFNYGYHHQGVLGINYNEEFFDRVRVGVNLEVNYNRFAGAIPIKSIDLSSWQARGRFRADVDLDKKKSTSLYLSYFYSSPVKTAQGYGNTWQMCETGGAWKKGKYMVQVRYRGLFNTGIARFGFDNEGVSEVYNVLNSSPQRLALTLSYNFGNTRIRKTRSDNAANDDQRSRMP